MLKTQLSSAFGRLLCFVAFALCFGGVANAQPQNQQIITLTAPSAAERDEGNVQTFRLQLSRPATQRLTVRVDTFEGTAFEAARPDGRPADYQGVHGDVTFEIGVTQVNVPVRTIGDFRYEFNETFGLTLSNPRYNGNATTAGQVTFSNNSATSSILDNDSPPTLTLQRPNATLEGNSIRDAQGNITGAEQTVVPIIVNINLPAERPLSVAFNTSDNGTQPGSMAGTATADQDYVEINNNVVTIPANATQYIYTQGGTPNSSPPNPDPNSQGVVILGDDVYEGDEAFTLTISYSPDIANTTPSSTVITITDNDLPTYTLTGGRTSEGSSIPFVVTLVNGNNKPVAAQSAVTFTYALDDVSATFGADYTNDGSSMNTGSFVIPIGSTSHTINIPILTDDIAEDVETFQFRIVSVTGARDANSNTATGTIVNVNTNPVISIANSSVVEGTNGVTNMVFTVSLSNSSTQQITVDYETLDDSTVPVEQRATSGVDYAARTGTVTFPPVTGASGPANTTQTFSIPITTDRINEQDETFRVRLFNPAGGSVSFPNDATEIFATGTIIDDDPAGTVSMAKTEAAVPENIAGGKINVVVNLVPIGTPARPVTVNFMTIPGTATEAATGQRDYFGKKGSIVFQPKAGTSSLSIPIEIINDDIREGDETFTVRLTSVDGATLDVDHRDTVVTITNDDPLPTISVLPASPIREDGGIKNFVIAINGKSQVPVTVNYAFGAATDTATAGLDYTSADDKNPTVLTGTQTFTLGGPVSYFIPVKILEDDIAEGNETLSLVLSKSQDDQTFNLSPSATTSVVTIVDDDATPSLKIGDQTVVEGNTADAASVLNFPVTLSRVSSRPVTFTYSTLNLRQPDCIPANGCDVASDDDYASVRNVVVTIPAGQTSANIAVNVTPDTLNEYNEQFAVVARSLVNAVPLVTNVEPTDANPNPSPRFGTVAFGTITNDDPGGVITITGPFTDATGTTAVTNLVEGYKRNATDQSIGNVGNFRVTLPAPAGRPITVNYTIGGAVESSDIQDITTGAGPTGLLKGQVTFFRGDTTRNIALRAVADNVREDQNETLRVTIAIDDTNGTNSYSVDPKAQSAETVIVDRTPSVASFTPAVGFPAYGTVAATKVTINGKLLRTDGNPRVKSVVFTGGAEVGLGGIQYLSDNAIVVSVPDTAKSGPITLRLLDGTTVLGFPTPTGATASPSFLVQPVVQSISPATAVRGATVVTINGRNFNDPNNAVTGVQFNGSKTPVPVGEFKTVDAANRDTQIQVTVPADAVSGPINIVTKNGNGPASQAALTVISASKGSIAFESNPDLNPIVEGSVGSTSDISQTVQNYDGVSNNTLHRPYQLFIRPATQTSGANSGQPLEQTPITIVIKVTSSTDSGRKPQILVRGDLTGAGRPTFQAYSGSNGNNGTVTVRIPASYNPANPLQIGIVDAGTDTDPPVTGSAPAATVTVTAQVTQTDNAAFFPVTPDNQVQFVRVERREIVTNVNQTVVTFPANTVDSFSIPFSTDNANSVAITDVFTTTQAAGNYAIYRFNASGQLNSRSTDGSDFVRLSATDRLQRGVGYRIVTGSQEVNLKARGDNLQTISADNYSLNLTRNIPFAANASNSANATNGYNFIGFPFNNRAFSGVNFSNTTVTVDGTTRSFSDAVAAGLINSQLYTVNSSGALTPVSGDPIIRPFKAYFVQIFRDNLTITLKNPSK